MVGNDLGVGRDRAGDPQLVLGAEITVVVDVAVEGRHHVRRVGALLGAGSLGLVGVERVGVRLTDDADARPPRVSDQRSPRPWRRHGSPEECVGGERRAECCGVVAELADLGRLLVDERQDRPAVSVVRGDDRPVLEQRVVAALGDERSERVGVEIVIPDVEVDARRVAAADLEAIDRGERLLRDEVCPHRRDRGLGTGERLDLTRGAEAVVANRPEDVGELEQLGVRVFEFVG